ncbi:hypothetical protein AKJ38_01015 [candidate division MSBL1 archaeon SCGC-AAA259I14]|uniref:CBS domain-containing protein n=1 Tax=candidate division MSBL1 archaeon SCGC-AAA259I14 TaxID=1698268 RepID=A0A133UTU0_9EURY|nr:hypothetical protein AKJ38_01015 [candidate division MSBL1 archaeon SCGC-AAA259I14]
MTKDVINFKPEDSLATVAKTFIEEKISAGPVVGEDNRVVGIISESDLMGVLEYHEDLGSELLTLVPGYGGRWSFQRSFEEVDEWLQRVEEGKVKDEMTKKVFTVNPEDDVAKIEEAMVLRKVNQVPVVDEEGKLVGIVARADLIRARS